MGEISIEGHHAAAPLPSISPVTNPEAPADAPPPPKPLKIPDFLEEAQVLEWAGVDLGRTETLKIALSLHQLSQQLDEAGRPYPFLSIRFWGKIFGLSADYWVAEALLRDTRRK